MPLPEPAKPPQNIVQVPWAALITTIFQYLSVNMYEKIFAEDKTWQSYVERISMCIPHRIPDVCFWLFPRHHTANVTNSIKPCSWWMAGSRGGWKDPKPHKPPQHLPFCPSVSLSASESDVIGFFLFIRRTSSSLSLPLADSTKEQNYSQQIKNFGPQMKKFLSINKLWKCCIKNNCKDYYS